MDKLLEKLLTTPGISGHEDAIGAVMAAELKKTCDEVRTDSFGNVIGRKGKGGKKVMLAAHMDEIGLMVKHVSKEGFLSFIKIGGIDDRVLVGQRVIVAPTLSTADARERFGDDAVEEVKPYLRFTTVPA